MNPWEIRSGKTYTNGDSKWRVSKIKNRNRRVSSSRVMVSGERTVRDRTSIVEIGNPYYRTSFFEMDLYSFSQLVNAEVTK